MLKPYLSLFICIPITPDMSAEDLRTMVREVNGSQVSPEERLSDEVFKCDGSKLTVVGESFKMDEPHIDEPKMTAAMQFKM